MAEVPTAVAAQPEPPPAAITDRRPVPRGVLPRGVQTWIMAGVAVVMLLIMLVVGRPVPPARPVQAATAPQQPSADRVRDYQDRLRVLEAQALRDAQPPDPAPVAPQPYAESAPTSGQDAVAEDRRRREYERDRKSVV